MGLITGIVKGMAGGGFGSLPFSASGKGDAGTAAGYGAGRLIDKIRGRGQGSASTSGMDDGSMAESTEDD